MKIIHITTYPPQGKRHAETGGVASYSKNLVTSIPYNVCDEVYVLCDKIEGKYQQYEENKIKVIRCFVKSPRFIFQILREVAKINPDVIHIQQELALYGNLFTSYLLQWLIFLLRKYKILITLHGVVSISRIDKKFVRDNNSYVPVWFAKLAFRIVYKPLCFWTKKVIVHEKFFKNILIEEYGVPAEKISVIHHGVENFTTIDRNEACRRLNIDPSKNIVLFMGYLTGYKGINLLIDGFAEYAKKDFNAFLIIGAGKHPKLKNNEKYLSEYDGYVQKANKLIPEGQYRWDGFIKEEDISIYFSASDVSVYPYTVSMSSSGPMAIAIGHGKPFLASCVFKDVLEDERLFFERDAKSFSDRLNSFFKEGNIEAESVFKMKEKRAWDKVGEKTLSEYKIL